MAFRSARLEDKDNRTIACLLCEHTITAEVNLVPQNMWYMAHDYQNENPPRSGQQPCWRIAARAQRPITSAKWFPSKV
jgi:hypothetical protein